MPNVSSSRSEIRQRLGKSGSVHLYPLALEKDEAVGTRQELSNLRRGQRGSANHGFHAEVQHRLRAQKAARLRADPHRDLRSAPTRPPVGKPRQQAALFVERDFLEKAVCLLGGPCQRVVNVAGLDEPPHQLALLRSRLDRREQVHECFPVPFAGKLLQRATQRLVAHARGARQARRIGRQERKRVCRVFLFSAR